MRNESVANLLIFNSSTGRPPLVEGDTFELPILGSVLRYRIPHTSAPHILDASAFAGAKDSVRIFHII